MSTLAEIEKAMDLLPAEEFEKLQKLVAEKARMSALITDPFDAVIGSFEGKREATGRNADEILYGGNR
jgi:hypothetical protein